MVGDGVKLFVKVLWTHGLAVGIAVSASFVGLLVYLVGLDAGFGLVTASGSASLSSLGLASWLWQLVWLGIAHLAALLVGYGTGEAWTMVGGLRAGLVLCACEIGQVLLWGSLGCGSSVLGWSWLGLDG